MTNKLTVGIIQASPVFSDLAASLDKAVDLIDEAAGKGAKLVVFGDTWLAGYPCVVLAAGLVLDVTELAPELCKDSPNVTNSLVLNGGSCIIAPDGSFVLEPVLTATNFDGRAGSISY